MRGVLDIVDRTLKVLLEILMAAMVLDVTWQVVSRYLLRNPSSVTEEIARFLLIWIGLLGAAWAFRRKSHLGIDILTVRLKGRKRTAARAFTYAASIIFALLVMGIGGIRLVILTLELDQVSAALGLRMGYIYLAVPLSGLLIIFYAAAFLLEAVKNPGEFLMEEPGEENF